MVNKMIKDWHFWGVLVYVMLSFVFGIFYQNGLILFLGWNMILAAVVYALSYLFVELRKRNKNLLSWIVLVIFILFFPNAIYITTDFIHLQNYHFFTSYPNIYAYELMDWILFMQITIGAFLGAKLGISALDYMKDQHHHIIKHHYTLFLGLLFVLSSIGIYLGRFIRLNSWEIFDVIHIINDVFDQGLFFIGFVLIYSIIHLVIYVVMKENKKITV